MVFNKLVELGRVGYIAYGPDSGKLCAIVNIIDQNRAHVDGPQIKRQSINFKELHLTSFVIPNVAYGCRNGTLMKKWTAEKIDEKWAETTWAKKIANKALRAKLGDFDRFKLMKAKQYRNRLINLEFGKIRKESKKAPPKKRRVNKVPHLK
ncbi:large ribosomal subunit protein eL14-like [Lineus longissimus]|uniref:large ribosomal subunit protein eL14-like n=1 Tax=Lineus longissimus TaxID=88925 RepID=UPI00315C9AE8